MDNLSQATGNSESSDAEMFTRVLEAENAPVDEVVAEPVAEEVIEEPAEPLGDVVVNIDGKEVTLTQAQVAEAYKNGLRQADYSKKTMEVAETRKEAETAKANATNERNAYAEKLHNYAAQLHGSLQEQSQINMAELLEADPVEYLKQTHLLQQRQANLQQAQNEMAQINELNQKEQSEARANYLYAQNQALLDKLPAWKDEAKATADKAEIKAFLKAEGYSDNDMKQVADHRQILIIKDAMAFRKLLSEAPSAAKRVQSAPVRAERSGNGGNTSPDTRTSALKSFGKNPNSEKAAMSVFSSLL